MNIAQMAGAYRPVHEATPDGASHYYHVASLSEALTRIPEVSSVTVYGAQTSALPGAIFKKAWIQAIDTPTFNLNEHAAHLAANGRLLARADERPEPDFEVMHSHLFPSERMVSWLSGLAARGITTLESMHTSPTAKHIQAVTSHWPELPFVAFSNFQRRENPQFNWAGTVPHGINTEIYTPDDTPRGQHLLFLGRVIEEKGIKTAINLARSKDLDLVIAGRVTKTGQSYFRREVEPLIDGRRVRYVGQLGLKDKLTALRTARAVIMPTEMGSTKPFAETFGLSAAEAAACGTPVIASRNGALPEVIAAGQTGFLAETDKELAEAIDRIDQLDNAQIRAIARIKFSALTMAAGYVKLYADVAHALGEGSIALPGPVSLTA